MPTEVRGISYRHTCPRPSKDGSYWIEGECIGHEGPLTWRLRRVSVDLPGNVIILYCPYCGEKLEKP